MARIFVSHAAKDKALVEEFVDLLHLGMGVGPDDVFCTSLPGMGIPTGADFVSFIKANVQTPEVIILLISPAFLDSEFCGNEVGASWALSIQVVPLLIPPVGHSDLRGVLFGKQAAKLTDKTKLSDLRDDLTQRLSLTPFRTSHWERARDKFLARLEDICKDQEVKRKPREEATAQHFPQIVDGSGSLLKLDAVVFAAEKVTRPQRDKILVELNVRSPQEQIALEDLRPDGDRGNRGKHIAFAYQNDGGFVRIEEARSTSQGGQEHWVLQLTKTDISNDFFTEMNYQGYSADEIAEMKAGRVLINNPPISKKRARHAADDFLEFALAGGSNPAAKIEGCTVRQAFTANSGDPDMAMRIARLESVFMLKANHIVETIELFTLGPYSAEGVPVVFAGKRRKRFANEDPTAINVKGVCKLDE
jgi:hypothetical protein